MFAKLKNEIRKYNEKSLFKIRYRELRNGYSLYLDYQRKPKRKTINLKGFAVRGIASSFTNDKKILQKASEKRRVYDEKLRIQKDKFFNSDIMTNSSMLQFFSKIRDQKKTKNTKKNWTNAIKHFSNFVGCELTFKEIDQIICRDFVKYLSSQVSEISKSTYFSVFKAMLNEAVKRGIIDKNPAQHIKNSRPASERVFLTEEEVKKLMDTELFQIDIKNAFLFACFTGLRISDLRKLSWDNIVDGYLEFRQEKTKAHQRMKISESALNILEKQKEKSSGNLVFNLPKSDSNTNKHIKNWIEKAQIDKHITFHCSRHTFATLCLTYDIDIYTVSKLMGHQDIKTTQIYAKLIDKKRDQAVDKLPVI